MIPTHESVRPKGWKEVWKYKLTGQQTVLEIPRGAEILSVQTQEKEVCIWALVDPTNTKQLRRFLTATTGQEISYSYSDLKYIGTVQHSTALGIFVEHIFEIL